MESLWMDQPLPEYPALRGTLTTDVLVIGGGMAGLLCARLLTDAGVNCVVVEASAIGSGTTKNTTAKLTSQHGLCYHKLISRFGRETAGLYLQANEQALGELRRMCEQIDCDFQEADNFIYSRTDRKVLEEELYALDTLGYPAQLALALPLPFPTVGAVAFAHQGQFHPRKFLKGILPGLTIFAHSPVRELKGNTAVTDFGSVTAENIIVATHFPILNKHGSYFIKMYQQRSYAIAMTGAPVPRGMYLDAQENGLSFRGYGDTLILGGGGHRTGKQGGNWKELEQFSSLYYPDARITHRWAAQDCMTLDGMPYIGRYSSRTRRLYAATGFNKWGMTSSMVSALLLRDLILDRDNPYASVFSPSRSILHPQLGINLLESTKNMLSLSPKRCPHLGCALKWNPAEHSWDCPCHGSRFTEDGKLIDNPATGDLKRRE